MCNKLISLVPKQTESSVGRKEIADNIGPGSGRFVALMEWIYGRSPSGALREPYERTQIQTKVLKSRVNIIVTVNNSAVDVSINKSHRNLSHVGDKTIDKQSFDNIAKYS